MLRENAAIQLHAQLPVPTVTSGSIERITSFQSAFIEPRDIDIWLPAGYSTQNKYAVLYMNDGQNLFDSSLQNDSRKTEWAMDEVFGQLIFENKIRNCIIVGIHNTPFRRPEYFPQKAFAGLDSTVQSYIIKDIGTEPISDLYLQFVVNELKPKIDQQYSTLSNRKNTFIAGSSMGGLISLYAICEYPEIFGGAACISTHWVGCPIYRNNAIPAAFNLYLIEHLPKPKKHRIYFDYGTENLDALYLPFQNEVDSTMHTLNFSQKNWVTQKFPGEGHSEFSWSKRVHNWAEFLLSP